jgi:hypothetical protein
LRAIVSGGERRRSSHVSLAWQNPDRFAHFRYNHDGRLVVPFVGNKAVPNLDPEVRLLNSDADAPFAANIWAKFSDDIKFVFGANFKTVYLIKEKIQASLQAPGKFLEKVCGKTPINIKKVFEALPYQAQVPSDLGFPIIIETQATYLVSMK